MDHDIHPCAREIVLRRMRQCAAACPLILQRCDPLSPEAWSTSGFQALKQLVVSLSMQDIADAVGGITIQKDMSD